MKKITNLADYKKAKDMKKTSLTFVQPPALFNTVKLEDLKSKFDDTDKFLLEESNCDPPDEVA
jgi:hypothetical protein